MHVVFLDPLFDKLHYVNRFSFFSTFLDIFRVINYYLFMRLKSKILYALYAFILFQLVIPGALLALEAAPDITDREVVEKLAKLEAGQQALQSEMRAGQQALNQRISDLRSEMKSGQEALRSEMKSGQEALRSEMKSGQEALNKRLDDSNNFMLAIIGLIIGLFGYILWDRRTMVKPVIERVERLEQDVIQDLDLSNADGSKLSRLINAMRELARTDEQLATILRSFSLL